MPAKRNSKSTGEKRNAAAAKPTPAKIQRANAERKKYLEMMRPKLQLRYEEDKKYLRQLFDLWGGTDPFQWKIVDDLMAEAMPNKFYVHN